MVHPTLLHRDWDRAHSVLPLPKHISEPML
jgi:hypothetical protein